MKLAIMITSAVAILVGLVLRDVAFVIGGAIVQMLGRVIALGHAYRDARLLRKGTFPVESVVRPFGRVAEWIEGAITLTGLILFVTLRDSAYAVGGLIIWGGSILCYIASGIIAREVGGIPLSMGYGGWKVRRDRNGKLR